MDYRLKYLKYKNKYLHLKIQSGGGATNACIALFYNNYIYLVKEKSGKWNTPGGGIKLARRETSVTAAFREFKEETGGFDLLAWANSHPLKTFYCYNYHGHTDIFWYISSTDPKIHFKRNNETTDGQWYHINNLPTNLRFPNSIKAIIGHITTVAQSSKSYTPVAQSCKSYTPVAQSNKLYTPVVPTPVLKPVKQIMLTHICIPDEMGKYPTREACEKASD